MELPHPPRPRLRERIAHQASVNAIRVFVLLLTVWTLTRIVLAAIGWADLDTRPFALASAFGRGLLIDTLLALSVAAAAFAVGALTHRGAARRRWLPPGGAIRLALACAAAGFIAIAEVLFWDEFSTRFNFIAVDYLIYTTEVIGNIRESYPLPVLLGSLVPFGLVCTWLLVRLRPLHRQAGWPLALRGAFALVAVCVAALSMHAAMRLNDGALTARALRQNVRNDELARNGPASFLAALRDNELSFRRFYATLDDAHAARLAGPWPRRQPDARIVPAAVRPSVPGQALPQHVVIIEVESLSADYLGVFGNRAGLTPNLDRIAHDGVLFTQLYATGTRTVRGLEALSAALPPLPGQSLVRRPDNADLQTLGATLREHGFETTFLYGGYGYFDNMNAYFAANGYQVRDRRNIPDERIGFSNIWGISDEYLFDDALSWMDRATADGHRQLLHLMTTSNHRPYTYPEGRIDIPSKTGRRGAVKYTDWAIGRFIEQARSHPWCDDTLFVIVADHCGSVAGKTRIPPQRYHIPAIFYSPAHLAPATMAKLASQIDLVPTITATLGIDDEGRFFGQNLFGAHVLERAFLGNYQEIGLLSADGRGGRDLVVLSPQRHIAQYHIDAAGVQRPVPPEPAKVERAIADYQFADDLVQSGRYRAGAAPASAPRLGPAATLRPAAALRRSADRPGHADAAPGRS